MKTVRDHPGDLPPLFRCAGTEPAHHRGADPGSPERYVRGLYKEERGATYLHSAQAGSSIYEVVVRFRREAPVHVHRVISAGAG